MKNNKNTFDWTKWNTKIIHCPNELLEKLNMLNFIGKKVSNIFFVGIVFLDDEEDLNEKELYYFSIDEPIIIEFHDGNALNLDFSEASTVKVDMNSIPVGIKSYQNDKNHRYHYTHFFKEFINLTIKDVTVSSSIVKPEDFTGSHGVSDAFIDEQDTFITKIEIFFTEGYSLSLASDFDYSIVSLLKNGTLLTKYVNTTIIHIPHSRTQLPDMFVQKCLLTPKELDYYNNKMTDNRLLEFFNISSDDDLGDLAYNIKEILPNTFVYYPTYSRLFVDMERFIDDKEEMMAQYGQGVVYTKTYDNRTLITYDDTYKENIIEKYYKPYHDNLKKLILDKQELGNVTLIDLHSFSNEVAKHYPSYDENVEFPDINVGYNETRPSKTIKDIHVFFNCRGYSVMDNYPYSGSYEPEGVYGFQFKTFMIEINKNIYLNNDKCFEDIRRDILVLISIFS